MHAEAHLRQPGTLNSDVLYESTQGKGTVIYLKILVQAELAMFTVHRFSTALPK